MGNEVNFENELEEGVITEPVSLEVNPEGEKTIPIDRFNQVYGKMKEYEKNLSVYGEFGKADELKNKLEKLATWEKAVEEERRKASLTPSEQDAAKRQLQIQKELYQVMPSLKLLDKIEALESRLSEYEGDRDTSRAEATLEKHSVKFTEVLKANKIDPKYQPKLEEYIVSQMTDEQKLGFVRGDFKIAEEIFNNELKDGLFASLKSKSSLPIPPVRNSAGGTPPKGQEKKPMTMKEAEDAAWTMMKGEE